MKQVLPLLSLLASCSVAGAAGVLDGLSQHPAPQLVLPVAALEQPEAESLRVAKVGDVIRVDSLARRFSALSNKALLLERVELYASGAQVRTLTAGGQQTLGQSRQFFVGSNAEVSVALAVSPPDTRLSGVLRVGQDSYQLEGWPGALAIHARPQPSGERSCGVDSRPISARAQSAGQLAAESAVVLPSLTLAKGLVTNQAIVAIDTDNELLFEKFGNNAIAAQSWIEDLFVAMNAFYEPDLGLRLLIGDVFLRIDTTPAGAPDYNADPDGFNDSVQTFRSYWNANVNGGPRTFAALLSGQGVGSRSFSGVAYIGGSCSGFGYSINRLGSATSPGFIAGGVGHEIGHNLGSEHTHCERLRPADGQCQAQGGLCFVDECYSGASGCYDGATSCPAGDGTLMSYCHASAGGFDGGGPEMGPPTSCSNVDQFDLNIAGMLISNIANAPGCFAPVGSAGQLFSDGFES